MPSLSLAFYSTEESDVGEVPSKQCKKTKLKYSQEDGGCKGSGDSNDGLRAHVGVQGDSTRH